MPDVQVGQVWSDKDPRQAGRTVEVMAVKPDEDPPVAVVRMNTTAYNVSRSSIGRRTTIRLDRFGVDYEPSDTEPHRYGMHRQSKRLDYWPVSEIQR